MAGNVSDYIKSIPSAIANATADYLANSDIVSRVIGMGNSYDSLMFLIQSLGTKPISLLGKGYQFIFDHVRRNYKQGTEVMKMYHNDCPKFTFYKERPTVLFANVDDDPLEWLGNWVPDATFFSTMAMSDGSQSSYAESNDGMTSNKVISSQVFNGGVAHGNMGSMGNVGTCDMIKKTNDNFNAGRYKTLIARFHTNSQDSKENTETQTAISKNYGMSHGRNLLKITPDASEGYDNPYCRVWTYHYQYNQLSKAIRPFSEANSAEVLESLEQSGTASTVGFRTISEKDSGFDGGSKRLDTYGVLNYDNNMVNIAPKAKIKDYFEGKEDKATPIKRCMFSIENLAWRDKKADRYDEFQPLGLSPEQVGPLGGRIMWFPPYDLQFSEDVNVSWNANQFIGRGEKIYTYTDTERMGNLSFTLLIDHPSILDYWTGHEKNGMTNQGVALTQGNEGGVDNVNNQENTLLRFFAGCDILTATPQKYNKHLRKPDKVEEPPQPIAPPAEPEVVSPKSKVLHCVLYYPNNYSGADDAPIKSSSVVNAVDYLMNGIGTQKYVDGNNDAVDIPTVNDANVHILGNEQSALRWGGYEVTEPVSVAKDNIAWSDSGVKDNRYEIIRDTYADLESNERKAQYLTNSDGEPYVAQYSTFEGADQVDMASPSYTLAKIVGSQALSLSAAKNDSNFKSPAYQWYRRRWYYRVDEAYENQRLSTPNSYLDTECNGLNSTGYMAALENETIKKAFGLTEDDNTTLVGFTDMYVALEDNENVTNTIGSTNYNEANVQLIRDIVSNSEKYKIDSISFEGHASFQGYSAYNTTLSKNRALTFKKWMQSKGFPNVENASADTQRQSPNNNVDKGKNSTLLTKMWRSASCIIKYTEYNVEDTSGTAASNVSYLMSEDGPSVPNVASVSNTLNSIADTSSVKYQLDNSEAAKNWYRTSDEGREMAQRFEEASGNYMLALPSSVTTMGGLINNDVPRYDNEGEFFKALTREEPFLHHLITDKIKYFDPAFHSVSPEGFNARLTFLHQCTRQGPTAENDKGFKNTAYNLAFGRPPVCVLRIGDFYYTKIIIRSLSIQFEDMKWDLNPEGIGVMPMFAKVNISFAFLGGSDLAGPIARLQNAVSFNYYANTGVYDNRAEMVKYKPDRSGKEEAFKAFSYPDMMLDSFGNDANKLK